MKLPWLKGELSGKAVIKCQMNGTLNYYESIINYPEIIVNSNKAIFIADVTLDAKVYGTKGVWTLSTRANLEKKDGQWYFGKWEN